MGLICLLTKLRALELESAIIFGDSQLVVKQIKGLYRVRSPRVSPLFEMAKRLMKEFREIKVEWVPRELNREADQLSRIAYEEVVSGRLKRIGCN
jgi:ribonuclease HI